MLELLLALAVVGTVGSLFAMSLTRDVGLEDSAPRVAQSLRRARADWELRVGRGELPSLPSESQQAQFAAGAAGAGIPGEFEFKRDSPSAALCWQAGAAAARYGRLARDVRLLGAEAFDDNPDDDVEAACVRLPNETSSPSWMPPPSNDGFRDVGVLVGWKNLKLQRSAEVAGSRCDPSERGRLRMGKKPSPSTEDLLLYCADRFWAPLGQTKTPTETIRISINRRGSGEEAIEGVPKEAYGPVVLSFEPV